MKSSVHGTQPGWSRTTARFTTTSTITLGCPHCESDRVIKVGKRDGYQRYQCKSCDRKFHANGNAPGKRYPANQMGAAVRLFYSGMSYKQIAENMVEMYDVPEPSKATIYEWVRDYTAVALREMDKHKAETGDSWVADEMQVTVGGQKFWNWNVMDEDTRYILASHLSKRRDSRAATAVMRKAQKAAANTPKTVKTDKLGSYVGGIENVWGGDVQHIQSEGIRAELNNNLSERLQGTYRQRTKTLRGLDNAESGQVYLDGWTLTYNLFRLHEALDNKTPASAAKVVTPYESWESVVEQASAHPTVVPNLEAESSSRGSARKVEVKPVEIRKQPVETVRAKSSIATRTKTPKPATPKRSRSPVKNTIAYHPFLSRRENRRRRGR